MRKLVAAILSLVMFLSPSDLLAKGPGSSGGGRSYSGGSSSSSTRSYSGSSSKPSTTSQSRSYTGGSSTSTQNRSYSGGSSSTSYSSSKPSASKFDTLASKDQLKAESRRSYQASSSPKSSYTTPGGKTYDIKSDSKDVTRIRSKITHETWVTRDTRMQNVYVNYWSAPQPMIMYNDHFNTFFWLWLLDRSVDERRMWAYNHYDELDQRRLTELRAKDAEFDARIKKLESDKVSRDHGYTPAGTEEDLMYTNGYVDAVYNPEPKTSTSSWSFFGGWCCWSFVIVLAIGVLVYFVFFHRGF